MDRMTIEKHLIMEAFRKENRIVHMSGITPLMEDNCYHVMRAGSTEGYAYVEGCKNVATVYLMFNQKPAYKAYACFFDDNDKWSLEEMKAPKTIEQAKRLFEPLLTAMRQLIAVKNFS